MKRLLVIVLMVTPLSAAAQVEEHCTHRTGVLADGFAGVSAGRGELTLDGVLVQVGEGFLVLENRDTGQQARLPLARRIKLRADKQVRREINGKKLALSEFERGQTVRVTLRTDSGEAVALRLVAR